MRKNSSIGDAVASEMEEILNDSQFKSVFASPEETSDFSSAITQDSSYKAFVRIAKKKDEDCDKDDKKGKKGKRDKPDFFKKKEDKKDCDKDDKKESKKAKKKSEALAMRYISDQLTAISSALDNLGLTRSSMVTLGLLNGILKEASVKFAQSQFEPDFDDEMEERVNDEDDEDGLSFLGDAENPASGDVVGDLIADEEGGEDFDDEGGSDGSDDEGGSDGSDDEGGSDGSDGSDDEEGSDGSDDFDEDGAPKEVFFANDINYADTGNQSRPEPYPDRNDSNPFDVGNKKPSGKAPKGNVDTSGRKKDRKPNFGEREIKVPNPDTKPPTEQAPRQKKRETYKDTDGPQTKDNQPSDDDCNCGKSDCECCCKKQASIRNPAVLKSYAEINAWLKKKVTAKDEEVLMSPHHMEQFNNEPNDSPGGLPFVHDEYDDDPYEKTPGRNIGMAGMFGSDAHTVATSHKFKKYLREKLNLDREEPLKHSDIVEFLISKGLSEVKASSYADFASEEKADADADYEATCRGCGVSVAEEDDGLLCPECDDAASRY